jgi:hypothetical protein
MEIYIQLFEVLFPVFFCIGIGAILGKRDKKFDTSFITSFAANVGSPSMIIYALNVKNVSFDLSWIIFLLLNCYNALALVGVFFLFLLKSKDIIKEQPPL